MMILIATNKDENDDAIKKLDDLYKENVELCDNVYHYFFDSLERMKRSI